MVLSLSRRESLVGAPSRARWAGGVLIPEGEFASEDI